jgi:hypothetical protein
MKKITSLALAVGCMCAVSPPAEAAGTYVIEICGSGPNKAWERTVSAGMVASPTPDACGDGLSARNEIRPGDAKVGTGAAARWGMQAPPGTAITEVVFNGRFDTRGKNWQAVLSNGRKVLAGCAAGRASCSEPFNDQVLTVGDSTALYIEAFCTDGPCNTSWHEDAQSDHYYARARVSRVRMTIKDPTPPTLANGGGSAWTGAWIGGKRNVTFDAADGSGVVGVSTFIDGRLLGQRTRTCGERVYSCGNWNGAKLDVDLTRLSDGQHALAIAGTDRAGNYGTAEQALSVDNNPPTAPVALSSNRPNGWTSTPSVNLSWTNPVERFAPIVGATVRACPAGQSGGCSTRDYEGANIASAAYDIPGEGVWDVSVWLRDAAGNASSAAASQAVRIGLDRDPPQDLAFHPTNRRNPSVVRVRATDALSGLARGEVQMRRGRSASWRSLQTRVVSGGLAAQIPDWRLRKGRYQLRARVVDVAGNERTTVRRVDGRKAAVRLPVRVAANMRVGRAKKVRARGSHGKRRLKTIYVRKPVVRHGVSTPVGGRLIAPGGNPLAGVPIMVASRPDLPGTKFSPVAKLRTSKRGRFSYKLPAGRSRVVRFTYRGARHIRPQQRTVRVRVRAATTIEANPANVVNGETVMFRGKIKTGPQPATGKLVELQYFDRGEWRTFRSVHASAESGRWSFEYRFTGTTGRRTYKFRARLPRESGYGYSAGKSRSVKVVVRGL